MTQQRIALARAFPILIGIVIFGAIIVFLALRTMRGIEQSEEVAARFEGLAERCAASQQTPAVSEPAPVPAPRGVAFRLVEETWLYDATTIPLELRAAQPEDAAFVLCLGPSEPLVTTACAPDSSGAAPTRVYGEALTARLLAVDSGELLAEEALVSAPEVGCRDDIGPIVRVSVQEVGEWLSSELETGD